MKERFLCWLLGHKWRRTDERCGRCDRCQLEFIETMAGILFQRGGLKFRRGQE